MKPSTTVPKLAVAHLTALELAPCERVRHAARAGFDAVGLRLNPTAAGAPAYPLRAGSAELIELRGVLADEGVSVYDVEFFPLLPDIDIASYAPMFDAAAALSARCVNSCAGVMSARCLKHVPSSSARAVRTSRFSSMRLHLARSGGSPADVLALPAGVVRAVQLCDASSHEPVGVEATIAEARTGRLPPGDGSLPLHDLLDALPAGAALGAEMPMPFFPVAERLELAYRSTRAMLASAHRRHELSGACLQ